MSNKPRSRKRNIVDGNVQEIKRQEEIVTRKRVGDRSNFIMRLFRKIKKEQEYEK